MSDQAAFTTQNEVKQSLGLQKVHAKRNPNYKKDGLGSYLRALRKYGFNPTELGPYGWEAARQLEQRGLQGSTERVGGLARLVETHQLVKKTETGSVPVPAESIQNDAMYLSDVPIGTPAQVVALDFDTGSSDLWTFSTELPAATQKNHSNFDPKKSSTWQPLQGYTWAISYGDKSSASGNVGLDVVDLGGLKVKNQAVELAQKLSSQFATGTGDGLLGLGFSSINTVRPRQQLTPVDNLIQQGTLPPGAQLFTSAFYSDRDLGKESFYTFGWVDQDLVKASGKAIDWTPIDNSGGWFQVPSTSAQVNGKSVSVPRNTAILDTGTTLALVSDSVVKALYAQIPGAKYNTSYQGWTIPLGITAEQLPKFSLAIGDTQFVIQPEDLVFTPVDNKSWYGSVQSRGDNDFDILGDAFLKSVYTIWDQGNLRVGLVPNIREVQNLEPVEGRQTYTAGSGSVVRD
ncbi:hypothetical protein Q8F55_007361 [Vanrija albida]|uniref:Peptidase A1 domain-containing protein n=1 Tax=Vanrija albida TaxID=181172 RepID=A0ABR3PTI8_9TREE